MDQAHSIAVKKVQLEMHRIARQMSSQYGMLVEQVKAFGKAGPKDLRYGLVESIKRSGFAEAAGDVLDDLQKINTVMQANIST